MASDIAGETRSKPGTVAKSESVTGDLVSAVVIAGGLPSVGLVGAVLMLSVDCVSLVDGTNTSEIGGTWDTTVALPRLAADISDTPEGEAKGVFCPLFQVLATAVPSP
eukprot:CAMPEP_0115164596 /NCGR_PEP_ID=MMETSP0227-20121206/73120_1 /TAXON_ID=89957 /ORGANISM="Polarella glacialis, Strain CCMP 1383" /LENGTH=107 /DNA_ID=CAMNT_0002576965 /DNA_START=214 /DNA_END=537 /DNA_ORIENTATION=-